MLGPVMGRGTTAWAGDAGMRPPCPRRSCWIVADHSPSAEIV